MIAYKLARIAPGSEDGEYYSAAADCWGRTISFCNRKYVVGETTYPDKHCGPLACFRRLKDAVACNMFSSYDGYYDRMVILRVEMKPSKHKVLWTIPSVKVNVLEFYPATVFADWVKVLAVVKVAKARERNPLIDYIKGGI